MEEGVGLGAGARGRPVHLGALPRARLSDRSAGHGAARRRRVRRPLGIPAARTGRRPLGRRGRPAGSVLAAPAAVASLTSGSSRRSPAPPAGAVERRDVVDVGDPIEQQQRRPTTRCRRRRGRRTSACPPGRARPVRSRRAGPRSRSSMPNRPSDACTVGHRSGSAESSSTRRRPSSGGSPSTSITRSWVRRWPRASSSLQQAGGRLGVEGHHVFDPRPGVAERGQQRGLDLVEREVVGATSTRA